MKNSPQRSPLKSLIWILVITICINGAAYLGLKSYFRLNKKQIVSEKQVIRAIVQTGPQKEALKTDYLAELIGLSRDHPIFAQHFNLEAARKRLLRSPVIKEASVKLLPKGILYIDYTVRQPCLILRDFENVALDQEGVAFPLRPFFSPKKLPEVYLGLSFATLQWNQPIKDEKLQEALKLYRLLSQPALKEYFTIKRIDVSKMRENSYGRREIVLVIDEEFTQASSNRLIHFILPLYLRLSTKGYAQELANYLTLRKQFIEKEKKLCQEQAFDKNPTILTHKIIDLRISQLAFIDERGKE